MNTAERSTSKKSKNQKAKGERQKSEPSATAIEVLNRQRLKPVDKIQAAQLSQSVLDRIGRRDSSLTITFIRDRAMQKLNRDYRKIDKPTDVLSFAYHEVADEFVNDESETHLGDVVISVETAERYAAELGLTFDLEIEHLIIHGTLHLAGYDHETDNGEMNRLERKLRKELLSR